MTPLTDQTFALNSLARYVGRTPAAYSLERPGYRRVLIAMSVAYVGLGVATLIRADRDLILGGSFLVIGLLQALQLMGVLKSGSSKRSSLWGFSSGPPVARRPTR